MALMEATRPAPPRDTHSPGSSSSGTWRPPAAGAPRPRAAASGWRRPPPAACGSPPGTASKGPRGRRRPPAGGRGGVRPSSPAAPRPSLNGPGTTGEAGVRGPFCQGRGAIDTNWYFSLLQNVGANQSQGKEEGKCSFKALFPFLAGQFPPNSLLTTSSFPLQTPKSSFILSGLIPSLLLALSLSTL